MPARQRTSKPSSPMVGHASYSSLPSNVTERSTAPADVAAPKAESCRHSLMMENALSRMQNVVDELCDIAKVQKEQPHPDAADALAASLLDEEVDADEERRSPHKCSSVYGVDDDDEFASVASSGDDYHDAKGISSRSYERVAPQVEEIPEAETVRHHRYGERMGHSLRQHDSLRGRRKMMKGEFKVEIPSRSSSLNRCRDREYFGYESVPTRYEQDESPTKLVPAKTPVMQEVGGGRQKEYRPSPAENTVRRNSRKSIHPAGTPGSRYKRSPYGADSDMYSLDGGTSESIVDFDDGDDRGMGRGLPPPPPGNLGTRLDANAELPLHDLGGRNIAPRDQQSHPRGRGIDLHHISHVSLQDNHAFSLARAHQPKPIARDWSTARKRWVASVACISTAALGIIIGLYAGMVPSIQYYITDFHHYAILGNVGFYFGLALPTLLAWPLPLLHGRKPYICGTLSVAMVLLFPQAIAVNEQRSPYVSLWRWSLLGSRALLGFVLGFASMNFPCMLTDLFGASLMSENPHQEVVDHFDVRRHGGGMGAWLGIWTWCFIGSLGVGFLVGAVIIEYLAPAWGFYISIIVIAAALVLNILVPEVRRSAYRRSVAEVRTSTGEISRRLARGEIMMHRVQTGPKWWGQEVYHGWMLSLEMLRQPGFLVMAVYYGWLYAQVVLVIVLLGSLTSRFYRFKPVMVGLCVSAVAMGALLASPFQKANIFSRSRYAAARTNSMTFDDRVSWTSHLLRRTLFTIFLPLMGILYAVISTGPPMHAAVPSVVAAAVGFFSCLAISECNGLIMETFDTSDLSPGMTGRARNPTRSTKRTNYSAFPRITAGLAVCHGFGFVFAAGATGIGGMAQRNLGQRTATAVVASVLFFLSCLLLATLIRFRTVQIVPDSRAVEMENWSRAKKKLLLRRRANAAAHRLKNKGRHRKGSTAASPPPPPPQEDHAQPQLPTTIDEEIAATEPFRPLVIGNPSSRTRRMNILELGSLSRWTEIRRRNRLIDEATHKHLNREALDMAVDHLEEKGKDLVAEAVAKAESIARHSSSHDDSDRLPTPQNMPGGPAPPNTSDNSNNNNNNHFNKTPNPSTPLGRVVEGWRRRAASSPRPAGYRGRGGRNNDGGGSVAVTVEVPRSVPPGMGATTTTTTTTTTTGRLAEDERGESSRGPGRTVGASAPAEAGDRGDAWYARKEE